VLVKDVCEIHVIVPDIVNDEGVNVDLQKWRDLDIEPAEVVGSTYTERNLRVAEAAKSCPTVLLTLGGGPGTHTETFGEVAIMGSTNGYLAVINDDGGISQLGTFKFMHPSVPLSKAIKGMKDLATTGRTLQLSNLEDVVGKSENKKQAASAGGG